MSEEQKDAAAEARQKALDSKREELKTANEKREGKGTRLDCGYTRGKNPQLVVWEAFDRSVPDSLPKDLAEFMDVTKINDESRIVSFLIDGYNDESYTTASDPIAEYLEDTWSDDVRKSFRLAVKNTSNMTGMSLEDTVKLLKPAVVKGLAAASK